MTCKIHGGRILNMKPYINVVGAALVKEGKVLALRRSDGIESVAHKFEFVGGKVEEGETQEQALERECLEELSLKIAVGERINTVDYEYPEYIVRLSVYFATPLSDYKVSEHEEERWVPCNELDAAEWAPADREFLNALKRGCVSFRLAENGDDFNLINRLARRIMHETYDNVTSSEQVEYMLARFLTAEEIERAIGEKEYRFKIVSLNGEYVGFYAYCPARYFKPECTEGRFLSKIYLLPFARGKKISSRILNSLRRPVYLTVNRGNTRAVNVYKHYGFKITESVSVDIGGGFSMDDYVMVFGK